MVKIKKFHLLILAFIIIGLIVLTLALFLSQEKVNIEIAEFRNITNQTVLQELFKSVGLDYYPLYLESYVVDYGVGNKTNWYRTYIIIYAFNDSNKAKNFLDFANNYAKNRIQSGNLSIHLLKNKVMIVNFYESKYINYVVEKFKNE